MRQRDGTRTGNGRSSAEQYKQQPCPKIENSLSRSRHSIKHKRFVVNQRDCIISRLAWEKRFTTLWTREVLGVGGQIIEAGGPRSGRPDAPCRVDHSLKLR